MSFDLKLFGGDLVIKDGDFDVVEDSDKLVQDVLKLVAAVFHASTPLCPAGQSQVVARGQLLQVFSISYVFSLAKNN